MAFFILCCLILMSLTACGAPAQQTGNEVIFAASATTGSFYQFCVPCCDIVTKNAEDVMLTAISTTGTKESIDLLGIGEVQVAGGPGIMGYYAYQGRGPWEGAPINNFSVAFVAYPDYVQIATTADSDIGCISDLSGKKISMNLIQSSGDLTGQLILESLGITDYEPYYMDSADSLEALQEGRIDAMMYQGGLGPSVYMELAASRYGIKLVPISPEEAELISANAEGILVARTVPAGYYQGLETETPTVGGSVPIVVSNELSEETVYQMVKAINENNSELAAAVSNAAYSTAENTVADWGNTAIPLHPGAIKYFAELGLMSAD